ncbi:MAG TPA: hypothetical protein VE826_08405 [Dongiaceae bacterium]|nr:hypothetical protein [Dongiaceae bacterium]
MREQKTARTDHGRVCREPETRAQGCAIVQPVWDQRRVRDDAYGASRCGDGVRSERNERRDVGGKALDARRMREENDRRRQSADDVAKIVVAGEERPLVLHDTDVRAGNGRVAHADRLDVDSRASQRRLKAGSEITDPAALPVARRELNDPQRLAATRERRANALPLLDR